MVDSYLVAWHYARRYLGVSVMVISAITTLFGPSIQEFSTWSEACK